MNKFEKLQNEAASENIYIEENYLFDSSRIKGLYCDNAIAICKDIPTFTEKSCVLAEELGHYHTSVGDILDMSDSNSRKQERQARLWAYNKLIGLQGLIKAHKHGCQSTYEAAEHLDVTEEFLCEAIKCYKEKYGVYVILDNYIIYFEPSIGVLEMI